MRGAFLPERARPTVHSTSHLSFQTTMRNRNHAVLAGSALLASLLLAACGDEGGGGETKVGAQPAPTAAADSACTAPAAWFPTVQQPVNFQVGDDNCNFHRWAWQEFMWLLQASGTGGQANFLGFADPAHLFVANPPPYPGRAAGTPLIRFLPRDVKEDESVDAGSIAQAGGGGVLIDQLGQPVFYAMAIDSTWYNFARTNGFNTRAGFQAAPDTLNFPTGGTGALEVKTSWRIAAIGDSVVIPNASSRFFTTQGLIPTVTVVGGKFVTDTTKMRTATLALAGMHVVGTVQGHPEFIWATFEQVDNAPMCSATPTGATNDSTGNPWSLYPANLACATGQCNRVNTPASFKPTPVCRVLANGDTTTTSPNVLNIQSLNASVQSQLAGTSILRFYRLIGGQWTSPGGLPANVDSASGQPVAPPTGNVHGSLLLANTTMESFHQGIPQGAGQAPKGALACFTCHNGGTTRSPKKLDVSHVWPLSFTTP
jgi:hypothetical protein